MGFFTNIRTLKEGEIILSDDHRHLYQITEGKLSEYRKINTPPGNPNLWVPGQKRGSSIYDSTKQIMYIYNIEADMWGALDTVQLHTSYMNGSPSTLVFSELSKLVDKLPKNTI